MSTAIKTAIASYGMSGKVFHGPLLKVNPSFEVLAVLERSKELSKELFPDAKIVRNYDAILNDSDIELVIVNTPDKLHYEMAKAAIIAGKHIVVEKPVTLKSSEAKELAELAKEKGVVFSVFQNRRWDADFRTVEQVIKEAKFGRLVEFESHFDRYRTTITPDTWKEEGDEYSGVLYNLGSHMVDQAFVLFGWPKAVTAHLKIVRKNGVVTDYYDIRLEYDEFAALLKCSYLVKDPGPRYTIHGEYGTFYKYGIDPQEETLKAGNLPEGEDWGREEPELWGTLVYEEDGEDVEELIETIPGNYNMFYDNIFEAIRNKAELLVKPKEAAKVLKILEACLLSNREKRTIIL
ncbi:Gfo/Idh/MocA family oxidoreductase [Maribellus sediminis]|uniref:Gfo/Idh/MocA family oxidoreductase n=1 Tax=Maribellus sediminis TaxID=2696285 RepID=UPI0014300A57|nr:Gfo/Idh/MocA family oxidoreductase [Maribellus sediminis]